MLYPDTGGMTGNQIGMAAAAELPPVSPRYPDPLLHSDPPCEEDAPPRKLHIIMSPFPGMLKEDLNPLTADLFATPAPDFFCHQ